MNSIKLNGVTAGYGATPILKEFSASFQEGKIHAIAGPNGTGKSTLFKVLLKEVKVQSGSILLDGKDLAAMSQLEISRHIAFVPQSPLVPAGFSVEDVLEMTAFSNRGLTQRKLDEALEACGILHLKKRSVSEISGGELQLVMLSRALCSNTGTILMDEPTSSLDISHQRLILETAGREARSGRNIIISIHDLNSVLRYADDVVVMKDGKVYSSGTPDETITPMMLKEVFNAEARIETTSSGQKMIVL